ncbi:PepSY domain-containing protein [Rhodanobacter aciditrophus]|uniref:PepSY domain-containing protein n=1 Tax=Rhodanobacter aciditrophus TaxID=1623218 RepID=A0ABW4AZ35_9GAMM
MNRKSKYGIIATSTVTTLSMYAALTSALMFAGPASADDWEKERMHDRDRGHEMERDHKFDKKEGRKHRDNELEMLALKSADTSMEDVIAEFRSKYSGTVVEVELDDKKHSIVYEVKAIDLDAGEGHKASYTLRGKQETEYNKRSLNVLGFSKLDDDDAAAVKAVQAESAISMDKALEIARNHSDAYIESIELENKRGLTFYKVEYMGPGKERRLLIDALSGEQVPSMRR